VPTEPTGPVSNVAHAGLLRSGMSARQPRVARAGLERVGLVTRALVTGEPEIVGAWFDEPPIVVDPVVASAAAIRHQVAVEQANP